MTPFPVTSLSLTFADKIWCLLRMTPLSDPAFQKQFFSVVYKHFVYAKHQIGLNTRRFSLVAVGALTMSPFFLPHCSTCHAATPGYRREQWVDILQCLWDVRLIFLLIISQYYICQTHQHVLPLTKGTFNWSGKTIFSYVTLKIHFFSFFP